MRWEGSREHKRAHVTPQAAGLGQVSLRRPAADQLMTKKQSGTARMRRGHGWS